MVFFLSTGFTSRFPSRAFFFFEGYGGEGAYVQTLGVLCGPTKKGHGPNGKK